MPEFRHETNRQINSYRKSGLEHKKLPFGWLSEFDSVCRKMTTTANEMTKLAGLDVILLDITPTRRLLHSYTRASVHRAMVYCTLRLQ